MCYFDLFRPTENTKESFVLATNTVLAEALKLLFAKIFEHKL